MSLLLALAAVAASPAAQKPAAALSPGEIVAASPATDWQAISRDDLLVMDLAPDAKGRPRRVVIQLMPEPFSQGWVNNVRKLAAAHWWDGLTVYRVQDNWVSQWGDADGEDKAKAKPLPAGVNAVDDFYFKANPAEAFTKKLVDSSLQRLEAALDRKMACIERVHSDCSNEASPDPIGELFRKADSYATVVGMVEGWPFAGGYDQRGHNLVWPVHCYGSIGVARDMPPDTGTGAELYVAIGHAPRQLDRNLAVVGRVIEGMQFLSSLPRGPAPLGVYADPAERTPILSVHPAREVADLPTYEYLSTESASFSRYAEASANHREPFYVQPAGGIDICNLKVPVRRRK